MSTYYHEQLQRGSELLARMRTVRTVVCGAGALGANIAEGLARSGFGALTVIDRDRVEERNLSTQPYHRGDIGAFKARVLAAALYRAVGADVTPVVEELTAANVAKLLAGARLVIDTFDNSAGRGTLTSWCASSGVPCLHAGLAAGYAEVIWNARYTVPTPALDDICDYPLARTLVMLASAVACESSIRFVEGSGEASYTITLEDLTISELPAIARSAESDE